MLRSGAVRPSPPAAEVDITQALVRGLLRQQHPDLAHLTLEVVGSGWDNALFRLGDSLAVRLPRRRLAAELVVNEQRWLAELAPTLPLPVPVPVRLGRPGRGYPWSWSIVPWFEGHPMSDGPAVDVGLAAQTLAAFLDALHLPAPPDAPTSAFRGLPLSARSQRVHEHVRALEDAVDGSRVLRCWQQLLRTSPWSGAPVWIHGDLHPGNVIVTAGRLAAVIDFGDLSAGDPATDLAAAWMLFPSATRAQFREALAGSVRRVDDAMWMRGRGWALALNLAWLAQSGGDEQLERETLTAITAVLDEC
jgi:aminoglycoside phosphotransferase (APT) family kinase protein